MIQVQLYPQKSLLTVCDPIDLFDDTLKAQVRLCFRIMYRDQGLGLAAPQLGILKRFFVCEIGRLQSACFVNPEIISTGGRLLETKEGCLSLPTIEARLKCRWEEVTVKAYNLEGEEFTITVKSRDAIIIQHEIDHLDGITLFQRIDRPQRISKLNSYMKKLRKGKLL